MSVPLPDDGTQWTMIRSAAAGSADARTEFARRYQGVIRAYLGARWRGTSFASEVDDVAQEVFVTCFRAEGPLTRADPGRPGGFRAFLYGIVRNEALMAERRRARRRERAGIDLDDRAVDDTSLSRVFDRAWAAALMHDAAELQLARAHDKGPEAVRRHELLAIRFGEGLPIRAIAERWGVDAALLHREYPKAREEFKRALIDVVAERQGGGPESVEAECSRLLAFFS